LRKVIKKMKNTCTFTKIHSKKAFVHFNTQFFRFGLFPKSSQIIKAATFTGRTYYMDAVLDDLMRQLDLKRKYFLFVRV
jgi:hypothetical protein